MGLLTRRRCAPDRYLNGAGGGKVVSRIMPHPRCGGVASKLSSRMWPDVKELRTTRHAQCLSITYPVRDFKTPLLGGRREILLGRRRDIRTAGGAEEGRADAARGPPLQMGNSRFGAPVIASVPHCRWVRPGQIRTGPSRPSRGSSNSVPIPDRWVTGNIYYSCVRPPRFIEARGCRCPCISRWGGGRERALALKERPRGRAFLTRK